MEYNMINLVLSYKLAFVIKVITDWLRDIRGHKDLATQLSHLYGIGIGWDIWLLTSHEAYCLCVGNYSGHNLHT